MEGPAGAAHTGHGAHGAMSGSGHAGHGDHVGQFRRLFWIMLILAVPVVAFSPMFAMILGYTLPDAAWASMDLTDPRHGDLRLGWCALPDRCAERAAGVEARDDAADRSRDHGRVRRVVGRDPGDPRPRTRLLVGTLAADRDHAARALARDALPRPDHLRAGLPGGAAARRGGDGSRETARSSSPPRT